MKFNSLRQAAIIAAFVTAGTAPAISQAAPQCQNCGVVVSTHTYEREAERGSGVGGVGGAVVGGLLGNKIGNGGGRTLATVAGAVGGAYAGNKLERNIKTDTYTDIRVKMARGGNRTITEKGRPNLRNGDHVRVSQGRVVRD